MMLIIMFFIGLSFSEDATGPVIGCDLGTTYSACGIFRNGKVEIIPDETGGRIFPSIVGFKNTVERLVGQSARNAHVMNPKNTVYDIKRLMGKQFGDKATQADIKLLTYDVVEQNGKPYVEVEVEEGGKMRFSPEEISGMILGKMKKMAESYLGEEVKRAVVTVPAYFSGNERIATKDAGIIAGLKVERFLREPTAAALAYGVDKRSENLKILVFDLGGGTFDVSILEIDEGFIEVLAISGDMHLGGSDFDNRIVEHWIKQFLRKNPSLDGRIVRENGRTIQILRKKAEEAKRMLSSQHEVSIDIERLYVGDGKEYDFSTKITRAKFEALNIDLFKGTMKTVKEALDIAQLQVNDIDEIILIGGSTRIPKIRDILQNYFKGKKLNFNINPDEAVAYGATITASILSKAEGAADIVVTNVTPLSLGIETVGGVMAETAQERNKFEAEIYGMNEKVEEMKEEGEDIEELEEIIEEYSEWLDNNLIDECDANEIEAKREEFKEKIKEIIH